MLFSGAAISLAAWGYWAAERTRPVLLPVCLLLTYLSTCLAEHLSASVYLSKVTCQSTSHAHLVCSSGFTCASEGNNKLSPWDWALGSRTVLQMIGAPLEDYWALFCFNQPLC